jgi:GPH family glycoside/pentoside/hexuronide:cation symporter
MDLIGARIMDEDTARYKVRREGIISNALGFMNRLNGLFTSLAFFLVFKLFGFASGDDPGTQSDMAARFLLTVFPFVLMLISLGVSFLIHFPNYRSLGETAMTSGQDETAKINELDNQGR